TRIDYGVLFLVFVLLCSSTILYFVEIGINDNINSFDDAFWYLLVTVTTVGYGDVYPKTGIGRIIGTIIMFTGIGFMSFLTATITYALLNKEDKLNDMNGKLGKIDSDIEELKEILKNRK
ncbi:MAG: two pore domain potassium channel family protein, partial [Methanobacterium sp.]|nr:two pore domain potassium channel family protein [Methanobacterium sp.]